MPWFVIKQSAAALNVSPLTLQYARQHAMPYERECRAVRSLSNLPRPTVTSYRTVIAIDLDDSTQPYVVDVYRKVLIEFRIDCRRILAVICSVDF